MAMLAIARSPLPERAPVRHVGLIWDRQGPRVALAQAVLAAAEAVFAKAGSSASATRLRRRSAAR